MFFKTNKQKHCWNTKLDFILKSVHYWNLNTLITPTQNTLLSLTLNTKNLIFPKDRRMANMIRPNQHGVTENKGKWIPLLWAALQIKSQLEGDLDRKETKSLRAGMSNLTKCTGWAKTTTKVDKTFLVMAGGGETSGVTCILLSIWHEAHHWKILFFLTKARHKRKQKGRNIRTNWQYIRNTGNS